MRKKRQPEDGLAHAVGMMPPTEEINRSRVEFRSEAIEGLTETARLRAQIDSLRERGGVLRELMEALG